MEILNEALGLSLKPDQLNWAQLSLRGAVIFVTTIASVRLGHKRFLARRTTFDFVLALILASSLSRAINGSAPFFPTIILGFVLVFLHRGMAALSFRWPNFEQLIKGNDNVLIVDGKLNERIARGHSVSSEDLREDLRINGLSGDFNGIKIARIERSGEISAQRKPQMFDIAVKEGVQIVHIEIEG
jgi:uncharacterized membrane protein YcaP (DUF421 family)